MNAHACVRACVRSTACVCGMASLTVRSRPAILREYDPNFISGGLDEASLDVTAHIQSHGVSPEALASEIRERVQKATQLTCSVGGAPNQMLAKVCSDGKIGPPP